MNEALERFKTLHPDYEVYFDEMESSDGYLVVYITEPVCGLSSRNVFDSVKDFTDWTEGVVLD